MIRVLWAAFTICVGACAFADTLVLEEGVNSYAGTSDTTIYQDRVDNSNGGHEYIYAGVNQFASPRRGLIRFDVTQIPAGSVVQSVELLLNVDQSRPVDYTYELHRVNSEWGEGTTNSGDPGGLGTPADNGDATWNSNRHNQSTWGTAGGDFVAVASASTVFSTFGTSSVLTSASMVSDVQGWVNSPSTNYGWIIRGEGLTHNARRFVSSEGNPGLRPRLTITYTPVSRVEDWTRY